MVYPNVLGLSSLMLSVLMSLGSVISPISGQARVGYTLAGVKDLYTKELVGYAINKRMTGRRFSMPCTQYGNQE